LAAVRAPHRHFVVGGLKRGQAGEPRSVVAELLVLREREERPIIARLLVVGQSAVLAALFIVTHAHKGRWIVYRQRSQQHRMNQGEDSRRGANAQRQCEDCSYGKTGGLA